MSGDGEFDFIARRLAPLAEGAPGAAGLKDDGALIDLDPGEVLAVTTDTLIEGRHFPEGGDPAMAARKALRVNLSDLAAMGARPFAYCLNISWPEGGPDDRADAFADGLAMDQAAFGVLLIGGDTTRAAGPWTLAVTAFGRRPAGLALRRGGAREGDALLVTGAIGDAGLGLKALHGEELSLSEDAVAALKRRSLLPEPRLEALSAMRRHASAVIDISDGLLADARHLALQSGLMLDLDLGAMPLSNAASAWLDGCQDSAEARLALASSGDDYELLIASPRPKDVISELSAAGLSAWVIGVFRDGPARVTVRLGDRTLDPAVWGFTHF